MRLMIVDDDDQIREGMAYGIQWENIGITDVQCFRNGKEALDAMQKEQFDIVLTDISMPVLSGIDLMKEVRERKEDVSFILISGYKEFEYAQAGLKYGAEDYILKPIHLDELIEIVSKVVRKKQKLEKESAHRTAGEKAEKERMLRRMIHGKSDAGEIRDFLKTSCGFSRIHALIGTVIRDDTAQVRIGTENGTRTLIIKKMMEYLAGYPYIEAAVDGNEIFLLTDVPDSTLRVVHLQNQIQRMMSEVNRETETGSFSAGISEIGYPQDISALYEDARRALEEKWFEPDRKCFFSRDSRKRKDRKMEQGEWNAAVEKCIREGDAKGLDQQIKEGREELFHCRKETVQQFTVKNLMYIGNRLEKADTDENVQEKIYGAESFAEVMDLWEDTLRMAAAACDESRKYSREVVQALSYVRNHYAEKITGEQIAEELEISYGYFSHLFKKQIGISFVKYLNKYRMDKAEELLKNTNLKVYEIAEKVGIPEYIYFAQVFRNVKGVSPTDIRK